MKGPTVYEIRRDGWFPFFEVRLSHTPLLMRSDIISYFSKFHLAPPSGLDETAALVHSVVDTSGLFCILFLNRERLTPEILCHEALHIAMSHERHVLGFLMSYGPSCGENEERLAYFQGRVFAGLISTLGLSLVGACSSEKSGLRPRRGR